MTYPIPTLKTECFSYKELIAMPIQECGEKLIDLSDRSYQEQKLLCGETPKKLREFITRGMWVREGVAQRLLQAQKELTAIEPTLQLYVAYAYRHPEVQRRYFAEFYSRITAENPTWSDDQKREYTHHYMAIPEVGGHPVGAAVDLFMVNENLELIDMGSGIGDLTDLELVPPVSARIIQEHQHNRLLLRHVMTTAGFAPYDFEWWHFSYGDREWACYYNKPFAMYSEIDFRI